MTVWIMQAGPQGEYAEHILTENVLTIGWGDFGTFADLQDQQQIFDRIQPSLAHKKQGVVTFYATQIWRFTNLMAVGDLVVLRLWHQPIVAIGEVAGDYQYRPEAGEYPHVRAVKWINEGVPRKSLALDLYNVMFANPWLFPWHSENAEDRVLAAATDEPGPEGAGAGQPQPGVDVGQNISEQAYAEISAYVEREFPGHGLAYLAGAILRAQGYVVEVSPPGPDGGIDIVAGGGPLGFDPPRMCVQVKSGLTPADVTVLRSLAGSVKNSGADYGLLVSWGGFTTPTQKEARQSNYFNMRLWDSQALLNALFEVYGQLPADIKARIPIKQIWIVADL